LARNTRILTFLNSITVQGWLSNDCRKQSIRVSAEGGGTGGNPRGFVFV